MNPTTTNSSSPSPNSNKPSSYPPVFYHNTHDTTCARCGSSHTLSFLRVIRSLTLESLSGAFGVSVDFVDNELSRFIVSGRLHCSIDKVNGIVETNRPALKNAQYETVVKQGDLLLNSVQRLSKVLH
jgi:hypothetical protein